MDERELRMRRRKKYLKGFFCGPTVPNYPIIYHNEVLKMRISRHTSWFVWIVLLVTLSSCSTRRSDESLLRDEFEIPVGAEIVNYAAFPEQAGWFGREGLKIDITFQLADGEFNEYVARAAASTKWKPLPIPEEFFRRMAAIETVKKSRIQSYQMRGEVLPPEGSVYNPTEQQMLESFINSLPPQPAEGLFQIRTAGTDIMHAPKSVYETPDRDLNDFMLIMLDNHQKQIIIKVSTSY